MALVSLADAKAYLRVDTTDEDAVICASSDLDEYLINTLKEQGAMINQWGVGTNLITSKDWPAFGGVYKLAGIKKSGKVVMNAVRSLSDSMSGVFTGLSIPEINAGQLAQAGAGGGGTVSNSKTINMGGLTVNVNGCNVQNDDDLADKVADRINAMLN